MTNAAEQVFDGGRGGRVIKKQELARFEKALKTIDSGWSKNDREFSRSVALFFAERLLSIEKGLDDLAALSKIGSHPAYRKRKPTAWQEFFAAGMKAGKSPAEIGAEWRERKGLKSA